jgi:hypothetical protein
MHVNLLPPDWVWRQRMRRLLRPWLVLATVMASLLLCANLPLLFRWGMQRSTSRQLAVAIRPVQMLRDQLESVSREAAQKQQKLRQLQSSIFPDVTSNLMGLVATAVAEQRLQIQVKDLQISSRWLNTSEANGASSNRRPTAANRGNATPSGNNRSGNLEPALAVSVRLAGQAADAEQVARLVDKLQTAGLFASVRLPALRERTAGGQRMHEFELECDTHE